MNKLFSLILMVISSLSFSLGSEASETNENNLPNDVDNPYTVIEIQATLTVFDDLDGDITENIYIVLDNYTGHENELGDFIIVFGVVDTNGDVITYAITIQNVDITSPVLSLVDDESLLISQFSILSQSLPNITALDSFEGDLSSNIIIEGLDLIDTSINGDYELVYSISDSSGNTTTETFTVSVVDSILPELNGPDLIIKKSNYILPGDFFINYFSATDNLDGIISNRIIIFSNEYLGKANIPGTYEIVLSVSDLSGNIAYHSLFIQVKDVMIPYLIIDNYYFTVPSNSEMSDIDFINVLKSIGDLPNSSYVVNTITDSYSSNYSTVGTYTKSFSLISSSGEDFERSISISVVPGDVDVVDEVEDSPGFFANILIWLGKWWWALLAAALILIGFLS